MFKLVFLLFIQIITSVSFGLSDVQGVVQEPLIERAFQWNDVRFLKQLRTELDQFFPPSGNTKTYREVLLEKFNQLRFKLEKLQTQNLIFSLRLNHKIRAIFRVKKFSDQPKPSLILIQILENHNYEEIPEGDTLEKRLDTAEDESHLEFLIHFGLSDQSMSGNQNFRKNCYAYLNHEIFLLSEDQQTVFARIARIIKKCANYIV